MAVFDDQQSLAYLSRADLAEYLDNIGEKETAKRLLKKRAKGQGIGDFLGKAYSYGAHVLGFIPEADGVEKLRPIQAAIGVEPDDALVGTRIKLSLDAFYVEEYPGTGKHTIALEFLGRDQAGAAKQDLRFATALEVKDQDRAGVNGMPIFTGLMVPPDGLAFEARTISVRSSGDEAIMAALKSPAFKAGLSLTGLVNPVLPQLAGLAAGVTDTLMKRGKNKQIQSIELGLDFSKTATSIRLRRGSYVAMQVPDFHAWSWDDWMFSADAMAIVSKEDPTKGASYNTLIFSVSESAATVAKSAQPKRVPRPKAAA